MLILAWCNNCGMSVKMCGKWKVLDLSGDLWTSVYLICVLFLNTTEVNVILYTLSELLVMLRWWAVPHAHNVLSSKDDTRWQVQPDLAATVTVATAAETITVLYVSVLSQGENTISLYSRSAPHHCQGRIALRHDTKSHHVISQNKLQL